MRLGLEAETYHLPSAPPCLHMNSNDLDILPDTHKLATTMTVLLTIADIAAGKPIHDAISTL